MTPAPAPKRVDNLLKKSKTNHYSVTQSHKSARARVESKNKIKNEECAVVILSEKNGELQDSMISL